MEALNRLKPYIQVGLCVAVLMVAVNVLLSQLGATSILGWLPRTMTGTGYLEDSRSRVDDATEDYRQGRVQQEDHLAAVVGISGVRQGIELSMLSKSAGPDWHFIGLGGSGLGIFDVNPFAQVLLGSKLKPDVVFLGLGLYQLLDSRPKPGVTTQGFWDYVKKRDLRNSLIALRDATWIYARRQDVNLWVQRSVLDARARMFGAFGVRLASAEAARLSPWREMIKSEWPDHFSTATMREEEQFFESLGVFERATYEHAPQATTTLVSLIDAFRSRDAEVVIVLMPEHPILQRRIPAEALEIVQGHLRTELKDGLPVFLDYRRILDEDWFVDLAHLNKKGGLRFSAMLAEDIRKVLPTRPSLMATATAATTASD